MGPDETLSPALAKKVVHAAACSASFQQAEENLWVLAEVKVSANRIHRAAQRIGLERVADSRAAVTAYQQLPLPSRQQSPGPAPPEVACIQADGGRIQIRPRASGPNAADSWWRETKVGCLLAMTSDRHAEDPAPNIPETFIDPARMAKISRGIKGVSAETAASEAAPDEPDEPPREAPQVVAQTVVATTKNVEAFGDSPRRGTHLGLCRRRAEGLRRRRFRDQLGTLATPLLTLYAQPGLGARRVLCVRGRMAGVSAVVGWAAYCQWAQWLWGGEVDPILEQLRERQRQIGFPAEGDAETSPQKRVADALRYLANQRSRMNYPEYRRLGLPITSSHVESTIKRINRRMKGTEKFWDTGADPLIHLVADHLSPAEQRDRYWSTRPQRLRSHRCYRQAA